MLTMCGQNLDLTLKTTNHERTALFCRIQQPVSKALCHGGSHAAQPIELLLIGIMAILMGSIQ